MFQNVRSEHVEYVLEQSHFATLQAGDLIVEEGEAADSFFLLLDGEVTVDKNDDVSGETFTMQTLRSGDAFGELALLTGHTRSATVREKKQSPC